MSVIQKLQSGYFDIIYYRLITLEITNRGSILNGQTILTTEALMLLLNLSIQKQIL